MSWKCKIKGFWTWKSPKSDYEMIDLWLTEGDGYRFWTIKFSGFSVFVKNHNVALKVANIIRKHLVEAGKEVKDLVIKYEMITETDLKDHAINQHMDYEQKSWFETIEDEMEREVKEFA